MRKLIFLILFTFVIVSATETFAAVGSKLSGQGNVNVQHSTYGTWAAPNQLVININGTEYKINNAVVKYDSSSRARIEANLHTDSVSSSSRDSGSLSRSTREIDRSSTRPSPLTANISQSYEITLYYPANIRTQAYSKTTSQGAKIKVKSDGEYFWAKSTRPDSNGTVRVNYIGDGSDRYVYGVFIGTLKTSSGESLSVKGNFKVAKP